MPKLSLSLPVKGQIFVKTGDRVEKNSVLAQYEEKTVVPLDLAKHFHLKPKEVVGCLGKRVGDKIVKGEMIACRKNFFTRQFFKSPVSGIVDSYNEITGILNILSACKEHSLFSPVDGNVVSVDEDKEVHLDFNGEVFNAKQAAGNKIGKIYVINTDKMPVESFVVAKNMQGNILLAYSWPKTSLVKAGALDCGVLGVEFETDPGKLFKNSYLADGTLSYMIIGRDVFDELIKTEYENGIMIGEEKKLFIAK